MKQFALAVLLSSVLLTAAHADVEKQPPRVEVAFVLDTTGSMSGLIAAAKEKIWAIANSLATTDPAPEIKMGLVGYRDRGDAYVTRQTALTDDLDAVYKELMAYEANGGGDTPESVNQALHEAVSNLQWSHDTTTYKVIYLVGDCPPHMDYQDDVHYQATCQKAVKQDIVINTIQCGNHTDTTPIWQEIARLAEGQYFQVEQSGNAILTATPFDEDIARLSRELDSTRLYYGKGEVRLQQRAKLAREESLYEAAPAASIAQRAEFNAKSAGTKNFVGNQELVQAIEDNAIDLDSLASDELPESMREMTPAEREAHVKAMAEKRASLQKRIAQLAQKRKAYIEAKLKEQGLAKEGSLDSALFDSIRSQAAKKNIEYKADAMAY